MAWHWYTPTSRTHHIRVRRDKGAEGRWRFAVVHTITGRVDLVDVIEDGFFSQQECEAHAVHVMSMLGTNKLRIV